ncbi:NAD(P)/FAD-dependent oxidoreductase [Pseudorhodobacter sp.]|uniref:NAD(P)/FAD-dependent oxidoreductase n=1 Tax=Pseudorhodobacter sp. TaxID=1934400 RepID=UPI0039E2BF7C
MPAPKTLIIGTGIVGIATAYYLARAEKNARITLVDRDQPMSYTSAQSGENYRNWWSEPTMVNFTNRSIALMEEIARASGNQINMNRRGYALATRRTDIDDLVEQVRKGFGDASERLLRFHDKPQADDYHSFKSPDWEGVPDGLDIVTNTDLIRSRFPSYDPEIRSILHVRRGGDISGQQLGMYMLEQMREIGVRRVVGEVKDIAHNAGFAVTIAGADGTHTETYDRVVNAAGPFADKIAQMLGVDLPVYNTFQQKIAFEDRLGVIPRDVPFSIDLDGQSIDWTEEERTLLKGDPEMAWLAGDMPGAIHCRPDGGDGGKWVKLGWAYNEKPGTATWEQPTDPNYPEIVLRGAARLQPGLKAYYGQLPRNMHHYGGWYTMTKENWPLIGRMGPEGAFMNCALSGYGTMAACAAGELCAAWMTDGTLPDYAHGFSVDRYGDAELMAALATVDRGIL